MAVEHNYMYEVYRKLVNQGKGLGLGFGYRI